MRPIKSQKKGKIRASLPDGQVVQIKYSVWKSIWDVWLELAPIAAERDEGVQIMKGNQNQWFISTVYAPQWEQSVVVVDDNGKIAVMSEQSAPY